MMLRWQGWRLPKALGWSLILSCISSLCLLFAYGQTWHFQSLAFLSVSVWIVLTSIQYIWFRYKKSQKISNRELSMLLGHVGLAISIIGMVYVSQYQIEREIAVKVGSSYQLGSYEVLFEGVEEIIGENYVGSRATFAIEDKQLHPEKRHFFIQDIAMSETAIWPGFFRDIYIAIGEPLAQNTWSARVYYKPLVRWIWLGAILMLLASLISLRRKKQ